MVRGLFVAAIGFLALPVFPAQALEIRDREPRIELPRTPVARCPGATGVGFQSLTFSNGRSGSIWYPTNSLPGVVLSSSGFKSKVAKDGRVLDCRKSPVVLFSHGFGGCSDQSLFIVESLAKAGFIVVGPNHLDSQCGAESENPSPPNPTFADSAAWNSQTFSDRRDDIKVVLDDLLSGPFSGAVNAEQIGIMGHSLGGYTSIGLIGGYDDWFDSRIKAALLLSPYSAPYLDQSRLGFIGTPIMFQGGTLDLGITPIIKQKGGVFDSSPAPKYFVELKGAGHFAWTNAICKKAEAGSTASCLAKSANARLIVSYAQGFLKEYLLGQKSRLLSKKKNSKLADYRAVVN